MKSAGRGPLSVHVPYRQSQGLDFRTGPSTTSTAAGVTAPFTDYPDMIEVLRRKVVSVSLGVQEIDKLQGSPVRIPRQTGTCAPTYQPENSSAVTVVSPTADNISLTPHLLMASASFSRQLLASVGAEMNLEKFVVDDLLQTMARTIDNSILYSDGTDNGPVGLIHDGDVTVTPVTSNVPSYADLLAAEARLLNANAVRDPSKVSWLTSPNGAKTLKSTLKISSGSSFPEYLMSNDGKVLNYPLTANTVIPNNLSYSPSSATTLLVLGDWSQILYATWQNGFELVIDPYSNALKGEILCHSYFNLDSARRHSEGFQILAGIA